MSTARYEIFQAKTVADRNATLDLWKEEMSDPRIAAAAERRMTWLYDEAPDGSPVTFLVRDTDNGQVIGCASAMPRTVSLGDRELTAGVLADFAVSRSSRVAGPAVKLQRALAKQSIHSGIEFLYGYPNKKALPIFKRLGFRVTGKVAMWVKPLRSREKLEPHLGRLAPAGAGLLDCALELVDRAHSAAQTRGIHDEFVERFDERFDKLWQSTSCRGETIRPRRNAAFLNWRYVNHATERYSIFTIRRGSELLAYAVSRESGNKAFIEDAYWPEEKPELFDALFLRLSNALRERDYVSICLTFMGYEGLSARLRRLRFFERSLDRSLVVYVDKTQPAPIQELSQDISRWAIFDGELDI